MKKSCKQIKLETVHIVTGFAPLVLRLKICIYKSRKNLSNKIDIKSQKVLNKYYGKEFID